jgi:hypothetical protein
LVKKTLAVGIFTPPKIYISNNSPVPVLRRDEDGAASPESVCLSRDGRGL